MSGKEQTIALKQQARKLIETIAPAASPWISAMWMRHWMGKLFGPRQRLVRERLFGCDIEPTVLTGPFRGMRYLNETVWGSITPKWLGSYEFELWEVVESSLETQYPRIISVGSAEGYYAVGYAWRNPACEVFSFDIDPVSRQQARRLAKINGVSKRLNVGASCSHETLNRLLAGHVLAVMDVEGYETVLLDKEKVPNLVGTDILVELHNVQSADQEAAEQTVRARFAGTHQITGYSGTGRSVWTEAHRVLWDGKLSPEELLQSLDEGRAEPQHWLWMAANRKVGKASPNQ